MRYERFHNLLRTLRSIDRHELPDGLLDDESWKLFRDHPSEFFIRAQDRISRAIYDVALSRQKWTDSEVPAAELRERLENMIDGDAPGHDSQISHALRLLDEVEAGR